MPDGNGFDICKEIKEKQDIPVIFLTAQDEETSVVLGLDLGADDYIVKPFRTRELISRIKSVLRRYGQKEENSNIIQYKNIKIDTTSAKVYKDNEEIIFTSLEYRILLMLFTNQNKLITRDQLLEKIWDIAGNFVNDNTLTVYIKRIREKLGDSTKNSKIIINKSFQVFKITFRIFKIFCCSCRITIKSTTIRCLNYFNFIIIKYTYIIFRAWHSIIIIYNFIKSST